MQCARTVRADMAVKLGAEAPVSQRVESNNSLLYRPIYCVQHAGRPQLNRYLVRPGAACVENDLFGLPTYNPTPDHDEVDFNLLSIMVCPECLFSSAHVGYFLDPAEKKEKRHHFDAATLRALVNDMPGRIEIFTNRSGDFFTENRTAEDAKIACEMAIRCSEILHQQNPLSLPIELLRLANYRLMLARLWEPTHAETARRHRLAAVDPLKRAITSIDGAARAKAIHQLVALGSHLGDREMAKYYLTLLADLEAAAPAAMKDEVQPYLHQARQLMEKVA